MAQSGVRCPVHSPSTPLAEGAVAGALAVHGGTVSGPVHTVPEGCQDSAQLLLREDGFEGIALATGVVQAFATRHHQGVVESFVLFEHRLVGARDKCLERFALAVNDLPVPEYALVRLPELLGGFLGVAALHLADLELLLPLVVLEGLKEALHTVAVHPIIDKGVAAQIGQHLAGIPAPGPYVDSPSRPAEPSYV